MKKCKEIENLLKVSGKQIQEMIWLDVKSVEDCAITIKKGKKKYYCYFNKCYMLFSEEPFNIPVIRENKKINDILLKILKGGCSKAKYSADVNMGLLNETVKYNNRKSMFYVNFNNESICLNAAWLLDCLNFVGTNKIYFNSKLSPIVFKNEGDKLKRFGILFPIKKL